MSGVFFCSCGTKFKKCSNFNKHIEVCEHYVKTDGTYQVTTLGNKLYGWKIFSDDLL